MTLALTATCVGGRRALLAPPVYQCSGAQLREQSRKGGMYRPDPGVGGQMWGLTRREVQALEAVIAHGHAKVAAQALGMSIKTLEIHMGRARVKSGIGHIAPLTAAYVTAKLKQDMAQERIGGVE